MNWMHGSFIVRKKGKKLLKLYHFPSTSLLCPLSWSRKVIKKNLMKVVGKMTKSEKQQVCNYFAKAL